MTVTKFPSTPTPIAAALQAAFVGVAFATGADVAAQSAHAGAGSGEESSRRSFRIPAGPLGPALSRFATAAGARLSFDPALTEGKTTRGLSGDFTREEGLATLLAGTGLEWAPGPGGTYTVRSTARVQATPEAPVPAGEQPVWLDPITVTAQPLEQGFKANMQESATKTPLSIRETPQSISVITQDSIKARQVIDIGTALQTVAGANQFSGPGAFAGHGSLGLGQVQIRGITGGFIGDARVDGFRVPIFGANPDLAPYERIEVVKGANSVLYGRVNAGGFLNRVSKKPLPEFHAEIAPTIGSFDFYRIEGDITGPLFESDAVRGRLVTAYQDAGSFVDGVESERVLVAPSLELDLTDSTRVLLQGTYQDDKFLPNPGFPLARDGDNFRAPKVRRSLFFGVPNEEEGTGEILIGSAQLEQDLSKNWLATLKLNRTATKERAGAENYAYGLTPEGDTTLYASEIDRNIDVWAGEIRLNGSVEVLGRPTNITTGVEVTKFDFLGDSRFSDALGTANIYAENFADFPTMPTTSRSAGLTALDGTGAYGQVHFRPFDRLSVLLGGRYDWADTASDSFTRGTKDEKTDRAFTGRAALTFDVFDEVSVYGLYAQSFEPVFSTQRDGSILDPETGETFEVGTKTEWLDGRLGINAALFRIERDDVPVNDPNNGPGEFFSVSAGLQRSDGFELEINGEPLPGWNLSFGGILLDSDFIEKDDPFFGTTPAGSADWQLGMFSSYELQSGPLRGLGTGVGLFAIGDRGVGAFSATTGTLEAYERVDLSAFYNGLKPFNIQLQVRNVFDEKYVENADRGGSFATFGSPLAVLFTVRYDFK